MAQNSSATWSHCSSAKANASQLHSLPPSWSSGKEKLFLATKRNKNNSQAVNLSPVIPVASISNQTTSLMTESKEDLRLVHTTLRICCNLQKTKIKKKRPGMAHLLKKNANVQWIEAFKKRPASR